MVGRSLAEFKKRITIGSEPVDLGEIKVVPRPSPEIGKLLPDFTFVDSEKNLRSIRSLKGKYVLVDVWAAWSKMSGDDNGRVREIGKEISELDSVRLLSLEIQGSGNTDRNLENIPGAIVADFEDQRKALQDLGVWLAPYYFAIDPEGNLLVAGSLESVWSAVQRDLKQDK